MVVLFTALDFINSHMISLCPIDNAKFEYLLKLDNGFYNKNLKVYWWSY